MSGCQAAGNGRGFNVKMKRHRQLFFTLFCSVPLYALAAATDCPAELKVPHYTTSEGSTQTCYAPFIDHLQKQSQCAISTVELGEVTTVRLFKLLDEGKIDFVRGYTRTAEREKLYHFSVPIGISVVRLYSLHNDSRWDNVNHVCAPLMAQARVLVPRSGNFGPELDLLRRDARCTQSLQTYDEGAKKAASMLMLGRADLLLATEAWWRRTDQPIHDALKPIPLTLNESPVHILYRKEAVSAEWVKRMDSVIVDYLRQHGAPCLLKNP